MFDYFNVGIYAREFRRHLEDFLMGKLFYSITIVVGFDFCCCTFQPHEQKPKDRSPEWEFSDIDLRTYVGQFSANHFVLDSYLDRDTGLHLYTRSDISICKKKSGRWSLGQAIDDAGDVIGEILTS